MIDTEKRMVEILFDMYRFYVPLKVIQSYVSNMGYRSDHKGVLLLFQKYYSEDLIKYVEKHRREKQRFITNYFARKNAKEERG